jgi:hypothetical protein
MNATRPYTRFERTEEQRDFATKLVYIIREQVFV